MDFIRRARQHELARRESEKELATSAA
jgi:hypothetical protein